MAHAHSYQWAVDWIAENDNPGDDETEDQLADYLSVMLVADIYDKTPEQVAAAVRAARGPRDGDPGPESLAKMFRV